MKLLKAEPLDLWAFYSHHRSCSDQYEAATFAAALLEAGYLFVVDNDWTVHYRRPTS